MATQKLVAWLAVGVVALVTPIVAFAPTAPTPSTGGALQHPIDQSGIKGDISFLDTGSGLHGLVVSGRATGLDPNLPAGQFYFSLLYDKGSVPGGPNACIPSANNDITNAQMQTNKWTVFPDGTGSLFAQKTGIFYVPLDDVGTVSIRKATPGLNPPFFNILEACGEIHRNP